MATPVYRGAVQGLVFRQTRPKYADLAADAFRAVPHMPSAFAATLAAGSMRDGGRFNPPAMFAALYVSVDRETALRELAEQIMRDALPIRRWFPRVMLKIEVDLSQVYDLTHPPTRDAAGLALTDIVPPSGRDAAEQRGFHQCQPVGEKAHRSLFEAIRYPSATGFGENFSIFPDRLLGGARVTPVLPWTEIAEEEVRAIIAALGGSE